MVDDQGNQYFMKWGYEAQLNLKLLQSSGCILGFYGK